MAYRQATDPQQLGALEFLKRIDVTGSSVQAVTFSDLNGDEDGTYIVKAKVVRGNTSAIFSLQPNGGSSNQRSTNVRSDTGGTVTPETVTNLRLGGSSAFDRFYFDITFDARTGFQRHMFCETSASVDGASTTNRWRSSHGYWDDDSTLLTSLVIDSNQSDGIAAGSSFELYRIRQDAPAVPLGAMEFLDIIEVEGSAVQTMTFGAGGDGKFQHDVNGDEDERYILKIRGVQAAVGNFTFRPNDETSNIESEGLSVSGGTVSGFDVANFPLNESSAAEYFHATVDFDAKTGQRRSCEVTTGNWETTGPDHTHLHATGFWDDTTSLVTSLVLNCSVAGGWGVGSTAELYRVRTRKAPRTSLVSVESELWVPPSLAGTEDDEFIYDSRSKYTITGTISSDPIDPYTQNTSGGANVAWGTRRKSWLQVQPQNDQNLYLQKDWANTGVLPTNAYIEFRGTFTWDHDASIGASNMVVLQLALQEAGSPLAGDYMILSFQFRTSGGHRALFVYNDGGGNTFPGETAEYDNNQAFPFVGMGFQKIGSVYHAWARTTEGHYVKIGQVTWTGGTITNWLLRFAVFGTNGDGTPVISVDNVRGGEGIVLPR